MIVKLDIDFLHKGSSCISWIVKLSSETFPNIFIIGFCILLHVGIIYSLIYQYVGDTWQSIVIQWNPSICKEVVVVVAAVAVIVVRTSS
jgi:uncharacterized membrane protein YedE/YeeE